MNYLKLCFLKQLSIEHYEDLMIAKWSIHKFRPTTTVMSNLIIIVLFLLRVYVFRQATWMGYVMLLFALYSLALLIVEKRLTTLCHKVLMQLKDQHQLLTELAMSYPDDYQFMLIWSPAESAMNTLRSEIELLFELQMQYLEDEQVQSLAVNRASELRKLLMQFESLQDQWRDRLGSIYQTDEIDQRARELIELHKSSKQAFIKQLDQISSRFETH